MDSEIVRQREQHEYTFSGTAYDEIHRALVFGLYAATEVERLREMAESDRALGSPWKRGTVPRTPGESTIGEIADALLWLVTTSPQMETDDAGDDA